MPNNAFSPTELAALHWVIRQQNPNFREWDEFMAWLEMAPDHNDVYNRISALDVELGALAALEPPAATRRSADPIKVAGVTRLSPEEIAQSVANGPANDEMSRDPADSMGKKANGRRWFLGGLAAALVAAISLPSLAPMLNADVRRIETAAGEQQVITLDDGTRIDVNGETVIELVESEPRFARLQKGEAMFTVVHNDAKPFVVETGKAKIVDLGTAFNVIRTDDQTHVSVSEGRVVFNPESDNVKMRAGQALDAPDARDGKKKLRAKSVDIAAVGGWRGGVLVYNEAPLSQVVADLRRTSGIDVSVSVDAADVMFRGALTIGDNGQKTIDDLAALSGTRVLAQGRGWMLSR